MATKLGVGRFLVGVDPAPAEIADLERSLISGSASTAPLLPKQGRKGGYHEIAQFFERLSKLSRIVNVGALDIKARGRGTASTLRVDGTATTFRFLMEPDDKTASTEQPGLSAGSERA